MKDRIISLVIILGSSSVVSLMAYGIDISLKAISTSTGVMSGITLAISCYVIIQNKRQKGQSVQFIKCWRDASIICFVLSIVGLLFANIK